MFYVNCISVSCTSFNISNLVTAVIKTGLSQGNVSCCTTSRHCDRYTTVIYLGVTCCYRTIFSKINSLSQLNFQLTVVVINTDVVISQFIFIGTTNNIYSIVKFLSNYFRLISTLCIVTSKFQTIVHSCYFTYDVLAISTFNRVAISIFWNIYDTFSFVSISTMSWIAVYKNLFTFSRCHRDIGTITAIDTIFTILAFRTSHTDGTVCTIDNYGRTVFTSCTNRAIFTISTIFTSYDVIGQGEFYSSIATSCIVSLFYY